MTISVAVAGATGYAGGEILRLLLNHPKYRSGELRIGALTGHSQVGKPVSSQMPHLPQLADRTIEATTVDVLAGHDVVFLGLPHGHSAELAQRLPGETIIIDCAADFRLRDSADWQAYYGGEHAGHWPYGIPEMPNHRAEIASSSKVAVPGCFPTGMTLALMPAVAAGIIEPAINIVSITGTSGAGKKAAVALLGAETTGNLRAYNTAGKHRHNPEVVQNLREIAEQNYCINFTPVLAPTTRGILTTATARLTEPVAQDKVTEIFTEFYADEPFVQVLPAGQQPETQHVIGANLCQIQAEINESTQTLLVTAALDNLTKGTGGAAVQCMNLMVGYDETAGLTHQGLAP
ncbi:N-acetyl-gamma-glutamyl-phosphate reductase [Corynebacterium sp.]|uniref:N-acetyl-gamma-glutamyl-phosphate reductase n=1 Tax=Corynebacterium sp. TaxID=1720 RepID=UPI0027B97D66|nr:N-acetyl-gamma-glutamyl-phosphate reductase [Corynebacterium sp.]